MKGKKILAILLAMALTIALSAPALAESEDFVIVAQELREYKGSGGNVVIPDGVEEIGVEAFKDCKSLLSVTIPDSVTQIYHHAFAGCNSLKKVVLGAGITDFSFSSGVFSGCDALTEFVVSKDNSELSALGGVLFNKKQTKIIRYPTGRSGRYTIPNGVTEIGNKSFSECTKLTSLTIPDSVKYVDSNFSGCTALCEIRVSKENERYSEQDGVLFNKAQTELYVYPAGKTDKNYTVPESVNQIFSFAFIECQHLSCLMIPDSVEEIERLAIYSCCALKEIRVSENNSAYSSRDGVLFNKDGTELICCPAGRTGTYSIPNGVTKIGENAFYNCTGLTSVTIPGSMTEIGDEAFWECTGLMSVTIMEGVTKIGESAFYCCTGLTDLTIPSSVTEIGGGAFEDCTGLTSVTIPDSVTELEGATFAECTGLTSVTIPGSVTKIDGYDFYGCTGLKSITIPASVTEIGWSAFADCTGLTSVTIPDSVTEIENSAFEGCTNLRSMVLPKDLKTIKYDLFKRCSNLTSVIIPDGVTRIWDEGFSYCVSLTSIAIPKVKTIEEGAFAYCRALKSITLGKDLSSVGRLAFTGCTELKDVYYGGTEAQWKAISIDQGNEALRGAVIHYNSSGPSTVSVLADGVPVIWTDAAPFIDGNNRTMVPLRAVADALGLTVGWDGTKREASFTDGSRTIYFPIDSSTARTGTGGSVKMDTAAVIVNNRTYAPIRYLAEFFGYTVGWNGGSRTVIIRGA